MDRGNAQGGRRMAFAGPGTADKDRAMRLIHAGCGGKRLRPGVRQSCFAPDEARQIAMERKHGVRAGRPDPGGIAALPLASGGQPFAIFPVIGKIDTATSDPFSVAFLV